MKTIYTSDNVKNTLVKTQKYYRNLYGKNYSIQQIIFAFNKLPGKYQDLLLKMDKDENDKANMTHVHDYFRKGLLIAKNVPADIKINIKNIHEEEVKKKSVITIEDVESDKGDKWVKPVESKPKRIIETSFPKAQEKETKKVVKKQEKKDVVKEEKETIKEINKVDEIKQKEELNKRIKEVVLGEYIFERQKIDIESILDKLDMEEDEKYIILVKYDNNSVKTNEEVSKEIGITTPYIDEVVDRFLSMAIDLKKTKVYSFERK